MSSPENFEPSSLQAVLATIIAEGRSRDQKQDLQFESIKNEIREHKRVLESTNEHLIVWQKKQDDRLELVEQAADEQHGAVRVLKWIGGAAVGVFSILEGYRTFFGGNPPLNKP